MPQLTSFSWRGEFYKQRLLDRARRGLTQAAEQLRSRSVPLAPIDRGPLRGSAHVEPATGSELVSAVSYDTPYAVRQHEELDYHHEEGEAKYLERPLRKHKQELTNILANELRGTNGPRTHRTK